MPETSKYAALRPKKGEKTSTARQRHNGKPASLKIAYDLMFKKCEEQEAELKRLRKDQTKKPVITIITTQDGEQEISCTTPVTLLTSHAVKRAYRIKAGPNVTEE